MKVKRNTVASDSEGIESLIHTIRGRKVILDSDLAGLYGVETRTLNQAIKRNRKRFPDDFIFQLTINEAKRRGRLRSQIVILKRGQHRKYLPYAFTENGAIMAANVLNSAQAVRMSVFVVRAFVKMRELLSATGDLARQLKELEAKLTSRLDVHETAIVEVLQRIMDILALPPEPPEPAHKEIGFHIKEDSAPYRINPLRRGRRLARNPIAN